MVADEHDQLQVSLYPIPIADRLSSASRNTGHILLNGRSSSTTEALPNAQGLPEIWDHSIKCSGSEIRHRTIRAGFTYFVSTRGGREILRGPLEDT